MARPTFSSVVRYRNELLLPDSLFPLVQAPADIPLWAPFFVSMAEMVRLGTERRNRYGYRTEESLGRFPAGYTDSYLSARFVDFDRQWRHDPPYWRYLGGRISLELTIGIYVDERSRDLERCMSLILSHELLHVADEVAIVRQWLPAQLPRELAARLGPLHENVFDSAIRGDGAGQGSNLERAIQNLWVEESSRRAKALHDRRPDDHREIADCLPSSRS